MVGWQGTNAKGSGSKDGGPRDRLIDAAIALLERDGPEALQARKVSEQVGASTMAVYTHFGGMPQLVEAIARTGFRRLSHQLATIPHTDDPLHDAMRLGLTYRDHARANPQLYRLMFGITAPAGYRLSLPDPTRASTTVTHPEGQGAFTYLVAALNRLIDTGQIHSGDPTLIAAQVWTVMHGYVLLEITDTFGPGDHGLGQVLLPLIRNLFIGLGGPGIGGAVDAAAKTALTTQHAEETESKQQP